MRAIMIFENINPRYPIYIPSKDRAELNGTANVFIKDKIKFKIVLEPSQVKKYSQYYDPDLFLIMPKDNMKLLGSRLWIREHSIKNGFKRHWQFDDNITAFYFKWKGINIPVDSGKAIRIVEDFTDRYVNIGISGFNYDFFTTSSLKKPMRINCHVYSACLINNEMPYKWRLFYNDDTDLCLQVLTNNLCTVQFNILNVHKLRTMTVKGGNTDDLYKGSGRLKMARTLEEVWPQYVETKWRFGRPQHVVKNSWRMFKQPLIRRKDIDWEDLPKIDDYGLKPKQVKQQIKSKKLKQLLKNKGS